MGDSTMKSALNSLLQRIEAAKARRTPNVKSQEPLLVAVSKTMPNEKIYEAYDCGQRHFGENYAKELLAKAGDSILQHKCPEIKWHFIGLVQQNKIPQLLRVPNLYSVHTIDNESVARKMNCKWEEYGGPALRVMVQVNTSCEEEKNGVRREQVPDLVQFIIEKCSSLKFDGLMTIGAIRQISETEQNPDFLQLIECRNDICKILNMDPIDCNLSMGMSNDFEHAIELGSSIVRVGSLIFGERKPKVKE